MTREWFNKTFRDFNKKWIISFFILMERGLLITATKPRVNFTQLVIWYRVMQRELVNTQDKSRY